MPVEANDPVGLLGGANATPEAHAGYTTPGWYWWDAHRRYHGPYATASTAKDMWQNSVRMGELLAVVYEAVARAELSEPFGWRVSASNRDAAAEVLVDLRVNGRYYAERRLWSANQLMADGLLGDMVALESVRMSHRVREAADKEAADKEAADV